ncbi:hypothetical protein C8J56DRAFT_934387 [Mycena floridula]|nr:hypothetical protein C8J56DRAFT_934387 [Mycena floridula]
MPRDQDLPPPAYSQKEFEEKVSATLRQSLEEEESEFEEWDEAKFLRAAAAAEEKRPISPLRINKRNPASPPLATKQRPRWHAEASSASSAGSANSSTHVIPEEDEEDNSLPPPPFTAIGPSLDGPPYNPQSESPSPLNSPQAAPIILSAPLPEDLDEPELEPERPSELAYRHSLPPQQSRPISVAVRPASAYGEPQGAPMINPRLGFSSSVAYGKSSTSNRMNWTPEVSQARIDPTSFYNSAVSAHLRPQQVSSFNQPQRPASMAFTQPAGITRQNTWTESPRPTYAATSPPPIINSGYPYGQGWNPNLA